MSQFWVAPVGPFHTADGTAVTASATLTEVTPTPQIVLPYPMLLVPGTWIRFDAWGRYTTTATQGTVTFDLRIGTAGAIGSMTSVVASSALTWVASQTNRVWHASGRVRIRTNGSSGTAVGFMDLENVVSAATDVPGVLADTSTTATVNTGQANAIALGVTLSVASQSITCREFDVEVI